MFQAAELDAQHNKDSCLVGVHAVLRAHHVTCSCSVGIAARHACMSTHEGGGNQVLHMRAAVCFGRCWLAGGVRALSNPAVRAVRMRWRVLHGS